MTIIDQNKLGSSSTFLQHVLLVDKVVEINAKINKTLTTKPLFQTKANEFSDRFSVLGTKRNIFQVSDKCFSRPVSH